MENNTNRKKTKQKANDGGIKPSTIIVGAGWAGLACAIKLIQANHAVTIIEATPTAGGRAKSITFANNVVDNGQHLLIGAYTETIKLLSSIGVDEQSVFIRTPMQLLCKGNNKSISITLAKIFAPLHIIIGLILAKGLPIQEKIMIAKLCVRLYNINFKLTKDCTLLKALKTLGQSNSIITSIWQPIALAVMSTPIELASANTFFKILQDVFTGAASNSNWLLPKKDLKQILPGPAIKYLLAKDTNIIFKQAIKELIIKDNKCQGITNHNHSWHAQNVVLATPARITAKLLAQHATTAIANTLAKITYNTITTIYFLFAEPVNLPYYMFGLLDTPIQWLFDRKITRQSNILSAIITNNLTTPEYSDDKLLELAIQQLNKHFANLPKLLETKIIKEKKAAFYCTPEMQALRPTNSTNIDNLFLAGDYTQGNYPATIEGAVSSGICCAKEIVKKNKN